MKKILLSSIVILLLAFSFLGCKGTESAAVKPDEPSYTVEQVLEKAKARSDVGLDSHIEWEWAVEYLPAQTDSKLKAVWSVTQAGIDMNGVNVTQTTYFHEDTGTFTYVR